MDPEAPSRGGSAVATCPVCQVSFVPAPNKKYCGKLCTDTAWRRRHQVPPAPIVVPPNSPRRPFTFYECEACGTRSVGNQRCEDCGSFMRRIGLGGRCPHCDEAVALADLLDGEVVPKAMR
ncbi:MAG: hypothetical protein NVSMB32_08490 [Actinomycetota bacterium]